MSINGEGYPIDSSSLDFNINAIQWYGDSGHLEVRSNDGRSLEEVKLTSFDKYNYLIDLWKKSKQYWEDQNKQYTS